VKAIVTVEDDGSAHANEYEVKKGDDWTYVIDGMLVTYVNVSGSEQKVEMNRHIRIRVKVVP
jgi:hypothetical protein